MTVKRTDEHTIDITPTSLQRNPRHIEAWVHPTEGTSSLHVGRDEREFLLHLSRSETKALAAHLDPEAAQAKARLAELKTKFDAFTSGDQFALQVLELCEAWEQEDQA